MRQVIVEEGKKYSLEEYIKIDETGTVRHEFYNGKLIPMPGESLLHNSRCLLIYRLLFQTLPDTYSIFVESVKVKIEGEDKYVYPDIIVIKKQPAKNLPYADYIIYEPLLIAEVLSESTGKHDLTDKFILYQKISTLQYYLAVEPEKQLVLFYEKNDEGEWMTKSYTELNEEIELKSLNVSINLNDIYSCSF
ncbi:MAG: Uma2 family endonuclease [Segetibacter sp.]|nr:Uma2 family endonuclease [Segetibacter sp.]